VQHQAEVLGRLKGQSVTMLVHHSRNSAQKQWDETLVLALSGMARLLRAHMPTFVGMDAFAQASASGVCVLGSFRSLQACS
jgi:C-terminal region of Mon2 protein